MEQLRANYLVVKSNALIEARYSLEVPENRIVLSMLSLIQPHDEDFREYELSVKSILAFSGLQNSKDEYSRMKEALISLLSRVLHIPKDDGYLLTHWVSSARYIEKKGIVRVKFDPELKPYLLGLQQHFTQYPLKYIMPIRSTYSIRLYEMLKMELGIQRKRAGTVSRTLKELRELLDVQDKYPAYKDFKVRILLPAQRHLKEHTDLGFEIQERKAGRAVETVIFDVFEVKQNTMMLGEPPDLDEQLAKERQEIETIPTLEVKEPEKTEPTEEPRDPYFEKKYSILTSHGITKNQASWLASEKSLEVINEAIEKVEEMEKNKQIRNSKTGLLIKLIKEEASLLSDVDKEKRRLAREHKLREETNKNLLEKIKNAGSELFAKEYQKACSQATKEDFVAFFERYRNSIKHDEVFTNGELDGEKCKKHMMFYTFIDDKHKIREKVNTFHREEAKKYGKVYIERYGSPHLEDDKVSSR